MSLSIHNNVSALRTQFHVNKASNGLSQSIERLSSGFRINKASDKPAGIIVSEQLRAQIDGLNQAIANTQRASNLLGTAEGALGEISSLLGSVRALAVEASNDGSLDSSQIQANQDEVDQALATINRLANSTKFANKSLINGTQDFRETGSATAGIRDFNISSAQFGSASTIELVVNVTARATRATAGANIAQAAADVVVRISGAEGSEVFSFASGASLASQVSSINSLSANTGVYASTNGALFTRDFGSDTFVTIESIEGAFSVGDQTVNGVDLGANVNGISAGASGIFLDVSSSLFSGDIELSGGSGQSSGATVGAYTFTLQESGMRFNLGANGNVNESISVGIANAHSSTLGRKFLSEGETASGFLGSIGSGADNALSENPSNAVQIVDLAIADVSRSRARIGAFQGNALDATASSLAVTAQNLTAAESSIRDVDFAAEIIALTRSQILLDTSVSMLAQSNSTPSRVLDLLS